MTPARPGDGTGVIPPVPGTERPRRKAGVGMPGVVGRRGMGQGREGGWGGAGPG